MPTSVDTHNRFYYFLENYLRLEFILYLFWALFWTLNGLDKFFNGTIVQTAAGPQSLAGLVSPEIQSSSKLISRSSICPNGWR